MGKTIKGEERSIILKVIHYFEREKKNGTYLLPIKQATMRAAMATGRPKRTILKIKAEARAYQKLPPIEVEAGAAGAAADVKQENAPQIKSEPGDSKPKTKPYISLDATVMDIQLPTPGKIRKKYKKKMDLDQTQINAIRNIVETFYATRNEHPSLKKILKVVKEELNFPGQATALRVLLIQLGYEYKKETGGWQKKIKKERKTEKKEKAKSQSFIAKQAQKLEQALPNELSYTTYVHTYAHAMFPGEG